MLYHQELTQCCMLSFFTSKQTFAWSLNSYVLWTKTNNTESQVYVKIMIAQSNEECILVHCKLRLAQWGYTCFACSHLSITAHYSMLLSFSQIPWVLLYYYIILYLAGRWIHQVCTATYSTKLFACRFTYKAVYLSANSSQLKFNLCISGLLQHMIHLITLKYTCTYIHAWTFRVFIVWGVGKGSHLHHAFFMWLYVSRDKDGSILVYACKCIRTYSCNYCSKMPLCTLMALCLPQ